MFVDWPGEERGSALPTSNRIEFLVTFWGVDMRSFFNAPASVWRRASAVGAVAAATLLVAGQAVAHAPVVTITSPSNGATLYATSYPYDLAVAGTVTHDPGNVKLAVEVNGVEAYSDDWTNVVNQPWGFTYSVPGPGTYTFEAIAEHGNAEDTATAEVGVVTQTITVDYPAAPAVANGLLNGSSVKGKDRQGCVSEVALHMGPGTEFDGVQKHEAGYDDVVDTFLVANCPGY